MIFFSFQFLVNWIADCADRAFPVTRDQILKAVHFICGGPKNIERIADVKENHRTWYKGFMERHKKPLHRGLSKQLKNLG